MSRIQWDQVGSRVYQTGLDRGVLYLENQSGIPWNGLKSIAETLADLTKPLYFDGKKYADDQSIGAFAGKLVAFTYPEEFVEYDGYLEIATGLFVTEQNPKSFGLSFRTFIGNDVEGNSLGYKIHILYNLTAKSDNSDYKTVDSNVDPIDFGWDLTSKPIVLEGYLPTAYAVVDSRNVAPSMLENLENILYGTDVASSTLPALSTLITLLSVVIIITDNGDGSWTAVGPDEVITVVNGEFEIQDAVAVYLDSNTYEISSG